MRKSSAKKRRPTKPSAGHVAAPALGSAWGAMWRSSSKLDGETTHLIHRGLLPAIFKTRNQALAFIETEYGYIRHRTDLKGEPHGWRVPKPVRVTITPNSKVSYHADNAGGAHGKDTNDK